MNSVLRRNAAKIVGLSLILSTLGLIVYQSTREESSVTFYTPAEVYAKPEKFYGQRFRVSGLVLRGTKTWSGPNRELGFRMTDMQGHEFAVRYAGIPPDLFKEGQGVIVEGRLAGKDLKANNQLLATLLLVKHSEVYDTTKDHSKMREAKLLDSLLKDDSGGKVIANPLLTRKVSGAREGVNE